MCHMLLRWALAAATVVAVLVFFSPAQAFSDAEAGSRGSAAINRSMPFVYEGHTCAYREYFLKGVVSNMERVYRGVADKGGPKALNHIEFWVGTNGRHVNWLTVYTDNQITCFTF